MLPLAVRAEQAPLLPEGPDRGTPAPHPILRRIGWLEPFGTRVTESNHVVRRGDSLWSIAEAHLKLSAPGTPTSVVDYWKRVVAANGAVLRSGNPDLIFPGEVVTLPAVTGDRS